ncbi:lipopolysaccharide biosynthesis protein [Mycolicibacterium confluentis]|uniref:Uncharacterized protein n=1 Tax=Mycolicibacterium confluentis TaxID=28047 RepID=A0A7I7XZW6_9MYCO|nr:lipopolysaccharide biosynthesis protein [Mycolicibacterium confluentis]MCV7319878.1 lipopolysaccharide biosynthesis protein [Mycolicibacterium confluentis]ORV34445.1 hypothetical protein AWB99_02180 [Mycolicibacterium confluentis]BBZ34908.1 hypothetical protein MCNF_35130 [Mycolicibacterium confluentis]
MLVTVVLRYSGIALQFVILLVLARHLDTDDYGRYMLVLSAVLPTYSLLGLGVSETFVRDAPKVVHRGDLRPAAPLVGATVSVAVGNAVVIAVLGGLLVWLMPSGVTVTVVAFMVAFFIANGLMFNGAQLLLGCGFQGMGAFFFYPAVNVSLALSAIPYVIFVSHPTFGGVAVATSVASLLVAALPLAMVLRRARPRWPTFDTIRRMIRVGIRLSTARALYGLGLWLPTFIAGVVVAPAQAGYLGTAGRLAVAVGAVTAAVRFAIRPTIVRAAEQGDRGAIKSICGRLATITLGIAGAALVASALFGRQLIEVTFGHDFAAAATLLTILLVAVAIEAFAGPVDEVLKMTGHENWVLTIFCTMLPVMLVALLVAARHGVIVMAWVQVGYTLAVFGAMIAVVRWKWGIWLHPTVSGLLTRRALAEQAG